MPVFLTYKDLDGFAAKSAVSESTVLARAHSKSGKNTFLSYSSRDKKYIPQVIILLENHGAGVYVDDGDENLPATPSKETAEILRGTIRQLNRFVVFVTPNSKDSKWIPWELGLGDAFKSPQSVALLPATEYAADQAWADQEYLGLYQRIVWGRIDSKDPCWIVWDHVANTAVTLGNWIRGN